MEVNKKWINQLNIIVFTLFIFSLILSISLIVFIYSTEGSNRAYLPNPKGLKNLLELYSIPINILTVSVVLLGLWLTSERMKQTNDQIQIISDNNKFNNFYKHRENFIDFYKTTRYVELVNEELGENEKLPLDNTYYYPIYAYYFYPSYHKFIPIRNNQIIKAETEFLNTLKESSLNIKEQSLLDSEYVYLESIAKTSDLIKTVGIDDLFISNEIKRFEELYSKLFNNDKETKSKTNTIKLLVPLYWRYCFLIDLISFDGKDSSKIECHEFEDNYTQICLDYDLSDKYGNEFKAN